MLCMHTEQCVCQPRYNQGEMADRSLSWLAHSRLTCPIRMSLLVEERRIDGRGLQLRFHVACLAGPEVVARSKQEKIIEDCLQGSGTDGGDVVESWASWVRRVAKTSGPRGPWDAVSIAPDPGDQAWGLGLGTWNWTVIPTANSPVSLSSTSILWGNVRSEGKLWSLEKATRLLGLW